MTRKDSTPLSRREAIALGLGGVAGLAPIGAASAETMKTPGVYIVEKNAFPNSVVEVATAVPAFVGYTEKAERGSKSLRDTPVRITTMAEFIQFFGGAKPPSFGLIEEPGVAPGSLASAPGGIDDPALRTPFEAPTGVDGNLALARIDTPHMLFDAMRLFFLNGGGPCYIVSVGGYDDPIDADRLLAGLSALEKEPEPTMLVIPEAMRLARSEAMRVQQAMLRQCGVLRSRVAILDIHGGAFPRDDAAGDPIALFRQDIGVADLGFGAAYYPWLDTEIVDARDLTFANLSEYSRTVVADAVKREKGEQSAEYAMAKQILPGAALTDTPKDIDATLRNASSLYLALKNGMAKLANRLPPSGAMAGIYTMVDNSRGVWKAPANVSVNAVIAPSVVVSGEQLEDLNTPVDGKAVNAIRPFVGEGVTVWGARTLDGNSEDWRYISVRRTLIMIEQSIALATKAYVFEPNTANTWVTVKAMIENFLSGVWKQGGLAGATASDAFSVRVGLGETMTAADILDGTLKVTVLAAPTRPAEFIEISFEQQMQKS